MYDRVNGEQCFDGWGPCLIKKGKHMFRHSFLPNVFTALPLSQAKLKPVFGSSSSNVMICCSSLFCIIVTEYLWVLPKQNKVSEILTWILGNGNGHFSAFSLILPYRNINLSIRKILE